MRGGRGSALQDRGGEAGRGYVSVENQTGGAMRGLKARGGEGERGKTVEPYLTRPLEQAPCHCGGEGVENRQEQPSERPLPDLQ